MTALSRSFTDRSVKKLYAALVFDPDGEGEGKLGPSLPGEKINYGNKGDGKGGGKWNIIDHPIGRKSALTRWRPPSICPSDIVPEVLRLQRRLRHPPPLVSVSLLDLRP